MDRPADKIRGRGQAGLLCAALLVVAAAMGPGPSNAQAPDPAGRLKLTPELRDQIRNRLPALTLQGNATGRLRMTAPLRRELRAISREKRSWTRVQRKIEPNLLMEYKRRMRMPVQARRMPGAAVRVSPDDTTLVDIKAEVTPEVLRSIRESGGFIINSHRRYRAIRARIPIEEVEAIAASPDVQRINPAARAMTRKINTSQGDVAHRANTARANFGADGSGKKVCALSDSIESLASLQASGDLPATVDVLPSQSGSGSSEGTALLEILHDLAPGADLGFASAFNGEAQFAQNIRDLRFVAGCDVIVDDVIYFREPVFQDGIVAKAVDDVVADGALYFSSAGNGFNANDDVISSPGIQSGTWEGNFRRLNTISGLGQTHNFGDGFNLNGIIDVNALVNPGGPPAPGVIVLQWSDPYGASANDYDLYIVNPAADTIVAGSFAVQNGNDDPFEIVGLPIVDPGTGQVIPDLTGYFVLVVKFSGATRMIHVNMFGNLLGIGTSGNLYGHAGARGAIAVGAVDVADAGGGPFFGSAANQVEIFSSDGPRRIHYEADGTPITPFNFFASGGELRQKPEIVAADGVATATPGFNPFFGTSASAPHAAAIATLMLSAQSTPDPHTVRTALLNSAIDIEAPGIDRDSGHGIVDAATALNLPDLIAEWIKLKPTSCPVTAVGGPPTVFFESATGPFDGSGSSNAVGHSSTTTTFIGASFSITHPTTINAVGGYFYDFPAIFYGTIFAALIDLNEFGFPGTTPITLDSVIASTVFTPVPSSDFLTPLAATLRPGTYGVVFGSGLFGSDGLQGLTTLRGQETSTQGVAFGSHASYPGWFLLGVSPRILVSGSPSVVVAGSAECRIKGRLAVANRGPAGAAATTARVYYSRDSILNPTYDQQIAQFPVSALAPGAFQVNPVKLPIPGVTDIPAGAVVYVQLDVFDGVAERNELNNIEPDGGF